VTTTFWNLYIAKAAYGFNSLAISTCYVQEPQEQLPIMLQLVNTDFASSLEKNLVVCVVSILLRQDDTSFMSVEDLMSIGTQEEI